jgi:hypothetical protein
MAHGNTIAESDGIDLERGTTCGGDAQLDGFGQ